MKLLFIGADFVIKYLIGEILLRDQDGEQEITIVDQTQSVEDFFHFPPISKYAGDERITFAKDTIRQDFDVIIHNHNFIEDTQNMFNHLSEIQFAGRVIVISSWEVFGFHGRRAIPFDEIDTETKPTTPLGQTKLEIEKIAQYFKNLNIVIFRLSTIFGPYMSDDTELIQWLKALLTQRSILVEQPAARHYDLCYVTNLLAPIINAFTADLPKQITINLGTADVDFKTAREKGKDVLKPQIFEKNVVELLIGLRHLLDSHSKIEISNEGIEQFQGKGFRSQLKTEKARKLLDYYPIVDTQKGLLQTAFWLQKTMELDEAQRGRAIDDIYPTLDERMVKVGESVKDTEFEYEKRKKGEEEQRRARTEADKPLICPLCDHSPMTLNPRKTNPDNLDEECMCSCHIAYKEIES